VLDPMGHSWTLAKAEDSVYKHAEWKRRRDKSSLRIAPHHVVKDMMQRRDYARDAVVTEPVAPLPAAQGRLSVSVLGAGVGGNLLEWYDFGIYGLLAPVLARVASQRLSAPTAYSLPALPCALSAASCSDTSGIGSAGVLSSSTPWC
jgi:hypothetical protein